MIFRETALCGCYEITARILEDERGTFVKTFHREIFAGQGLSTDWAEEYYSVSRRGVLRGLHFQIPPYDHDKLVYCTEGSVLDAAVDLRKGSPTYGNHILLELSAVAANMLYLPRGLAHGFYVQSASATLVYKVTSVYAPQHDAGILWDSADIPWPDSAPILSERDSGFPAFNRFKTPFAFQTGGGEE